jgi:aryl-alcohol dehydrogenase-like predicted oxidoreductase
MRSSIHIVNVDQCDTWTRYRAGLCDQCQANCCTMPLEVALSDLVRLGWVDAFEAEQVDPARIAKRLQKARQVERYNAKAERYTLARRAAPMAIASTCTRSPAAARCTNSGPTPAACTRSSAARGPGTAPLGPRGFEP